jgi:hypothetical protein
MLAPSDTNVLDAISSTGSQTSASLTNPTAEEAPSESSSHMPESVLADSLTVETSSDSSTICLRSVPPPSPYLKSVAALISSGLNCSPYLNGSVWAKWPRFYSHLQTVCQGFRTMSSNGTVTNMAPGSWLSVTKQTPAMQHPNLSSVPTSSPLLTALVVDSTLADDGTVLASPTVVDTTKGLLTRTVTVSLSLTKDQKSILRTIGLASNQVTNRAIRNAKVQARTPQGRRAAEAARQESFTEERKWHLKQRKRIEKEHRSAMRPLVKQQTKHDKTLVRLRARLAKVNGQLERAVSVARRATFESQRKEVLSLLESTTLSLKSVCKEIRAANKERDIKGNKLATRYKARRQNILGREYMGRWIDLESMRKESRLTEGGRKDLYQRQSRPQDP